jgi:mRNA-degrading endonuclease YafQ of YafQ-DinJ toxin-antitoxin module
MKIRRLVGFVDAYSNLTPAQRERVDKALRLLVNDWRHPSLQVKHVRGLEGVWEARASLSLRITFEMNGDTIILRNVGAHDKTIKGA